MNGTSNLPAAITRQGGALERILGDDLEKYTDVRYPLDRRGQLAIGSVIAKNPELNNESQVAVLVDLFSYHGVGSATEFDSVVKEYGLPVVQLVFDYLFEVGERGRGRNSDTNPTVWSGATGVREICDLVQDLDAADFDVPSVDRLDELIVELGGLYKACIATSSEVETMLREGRESDGPDFDNREGNDERD